MTKVIFTLPAQQPTITINGVVCTPGEVVTLQSAVMCLAEEMEKPDPLGKDDHGRRMVDHYKECIRSLTSKLHP